MMGRIERKPGPAGARTTGSPSQYVCAECRYADLYALEPRAICTYPLSRFWGRALFAGQPACDDLAPRDGVDLLLTTYKRQD